MNSSRGRLALVAAAWAGVVLVGCSSTDQPPPDAEPVSSAPATLPSSPSQGPSSKASPSQASKAPSSASAAAQPVITAGQVFAFIESVDLGKGKGTVTYDQAQFLTGDAAQKAAAEDKAEAPGARDYYVRNVNTLLRTVPVAPKATIYGSIGLAEQMELTPKTLEDLRFYTDLDQSAGTPFWITVDDNGQITRIEEQFIP